MTDLDTVVELAGIDHMPHLAGQVHTVLGPIAPQDTGLTLMHEHVFVDLRRPAHTAHPRPGEWDPEAFLPLTLQRLAAVRRGQVCHDNDVLGDLDMMIDETRAFALQGGSTIVDATVRGIGRDPQALQALSRATGLHLIMGTGWYQQDFHPRDFYATDLNELAAILVRDIVVGDHGVRAGIIGEVGAEGNPVPAEEMHSVRAAGRASAVTGAPITLHMGGMGEAKLRVLDALEHEGADPARVVFSHAGTIADDMPLARKLLSRGALVEADFLGTTGSPWGTLFPFTDRSVAASFMQLIDDGWVEQLVLGTDVCQKIQLSAFGGHGYGYVMDHFVPLLQEFGATDADIDIMLRVNPARVLAFGAPTAAG